MSTIRVDKVQAAADNTDLTLQGSGTGTVTFGSGTSFINANVTGNLSVSRSLAVGYTDGRVPQANLEVRGNVYIGGVGSSVTTSVDTPVTFGSAVGVASGGTGATSATGAASAFGLGTEDTAQFYGANVTGNVSVSRSLAVGYTDGRVPQANLDVTGNTALAGAVTLFDNSLIRANLKDYGEVTNAIGGTGGGTQDIDLTLGNSVSATVDTSGNTFTFSNPTASDEMCGFSLILTNGGSQTVTWPGTVDWAGGTAPTLTTSGVDILVFITIDGGTIWHGMASSLDSKSP